MVTQCEAPVDSVMFMQKYASLVTLDDEVKAYNAKSRSDSVGIPVVVDAQ
jgi:hypothetical protein